LFALHETEAGLFAELLHRLGADVSH
jgi:hypothetical protein